MTAGAITYSDGPAGHMQVLTLGTPTDKLQVNAGGTAPEWVAASGDPHNSGMLICWAGTNGTIPTGWLLCDGASVATATYPDLFTAIGYAYGGAGANFNLPNMVSRFTRGAATQTAATGGADNITLSVAQMPTHSHVVTDPGHAHSTYKYNGGSGTNAINQIQGSAQAAHLVTPPPVEPNTTGITLADTGSSSSFDNRPAYLEMQYIIKT